MPETSYDYTVYIKHLNRNGIRSTRVYASLTPPVQKRLDVPSNCHSHSRNVHTAYLPRALHRTDQEQPKCEFIQLPITMRHRMPGMQDLQRISKHFCVVSCLLESISLRGNSCFFLSLPWSTLVSFRVLKI